MIEIPRYTTKLLDKKSLTHNVLELTFEKPENFSFQAGQFVRFFIPDQTGEIPRSYSLVSTPFDTTLSFCVKLLPEGKASAYFPTMHIGQTIDFDGPRGRFCVTEQTPLYFVATGSGIAPMLGLIRDELEYKKNTNEISLLFGLRHKEDIFWQDEFAALQNTYQNFRYNLVLSQPTEEWEGLEGRVTHHLTAHHGDHHFFICGSPEMVKDVRSLLLAEKVEMKKIHFEIF
ncbi:MAG: FAD-dependent oxidoreductase [Candidatus Magasanikbacteria bacterium]|jgi:ferredoxin-NADP reductase|nr:FAD-dependent oxidoreductase [Candidatus Magasanikbacteria bacterium]